MPLGADAGANIAEMTKAHGGEEAWPRARIVAAGMNAARQAGQHSQGDADRTTTYERKRKHRKQAAQARALEKM